MKGSFSKRVRAFAADIPEVANNVKIAVSQEFLTEVIPNTPVDTGQARSNWNVGIGGPDYSTRPTEGRSGSNALQRGVRKAKSAKNGQGIHISNGLPYINRLNNGWSKQAPAGFVERAYSAAKALLPRIRFSQYRKVKNNDN